MGSLCNFSFNDVPTNPLSAISMIADSGNIGSVFRRPLVDKFNLNSSYSRNYRLNDKNKAQQINSLDDILNLTSFGQRYSNISQSEKEGLLKALGEFSEQIPELKTAYQELGQLGGLHRAGSPLQSNELSELYDLDESNVNSKNMIEAAISFNVLNSFSGPGSIIFEGCDYHDGTQQTGDRKDFEIGLGIGRAVSAAHILKKPLMFQVISDGGVYSNVSDSFSREWQGDEQYHSLSIIGLYNPSGNIEMRKLQLGHFTEKAKTATNTFVGSETKNVVVATVANYLYLTGELGQFQALTGMRLSSEEIDDLLLFG